MAGCEQILVVEDNEDIREGLFAILEDNGYAIETAVDGREGLAKLRAATRPTLVLLDLMMPKTSGWEFLRAQKSDPALAMHKVVTVSAVDRAQWSEDRVSSEPDAILSKPIQLEQLWKVVNRFCNAAG